MVNTIELKQLLAVSNEIMYVKSFKQGLVYGKGTINSSLCYW